MLGRATVLLLPLLLVLPGCTETVDIAQTFRVVNLEGGWYDAGIVDGKNKLVPTVVFQIEKATDQEVRPVTLNILFRKIVGDTEDDWDEVLLQRVEFSEGNRTPVLTVRPNAGFTAEPPQSRADMLKHSLFVDVRAVIFAKQASTNWVELARFDIPRQLLTK